MKSVEEVVRQVTNRLQRTWFRCLDEGPAADGAAQDWPHEYPLGLGASGAMVGRLGGLGDWARAWQHWADERGLLLVTTSRRVGGLQQELPERLVVASVDQAALAAGGEWVERLALGRRRAAMVREHFDDVDVARLVRDSIGYGEDDFELLLTAAGWLREHEVGGLSRRQVPIEGLHAKWLDHHLRELRHLVPDDHLAFRERPQAVRLVWLDPEHLAAGGRQHDSVVPQTPMRPPYLPRVVLICENHDSALFFPPVPGGVAVLGDGNAGAGRIARVDWLRQAPRLVYWGDLDTDGFRIVNHYRALGLDVETILMDRAAVQRYRRWSSPTDKDGKPLVHRPPLVLPLLTDEERLALALIEDRSQPRPLRIEQERIRLSDAVVALTKEHHP